MSETRKDDYLRKQHELLQCCTKCRINNFWPQNPERCNYDCIVGRRLKMLEVMYSDVTGWTHDKW